MKSKKRASERVFQVEPFLVVLIYNTMNVEEETAATFKTKFRWTIKNYSRLKNTRQHSSDVLVDCCGHKWRIVIHPNLKNKLEILLHTDLAYSRRDVDCCLSVLNQNNRKNSVTTGTKYRFDAAGFHWGYPDFMHVDDLYDPDKGFLLNDTFILELKLVYSVDSKEETGYLEVKNKGSEIVETICPNCAVQVEPSLSLETEKHKLFEEMPQNPHYAPLDKYGDMVRKGLMKGLDIAFISLAEEALNLKDPYSFWSNKDSFIKQLTELEEMGYNVEKLREHLQILEKFAELERANKEALGKLEAEMKEHEMKITELKAETDIVKKDLDNALTGFVSSAKRMQK